MFYKPCWTRIIFLATLINFCLVILADNFFTAEEKLSVEDDMEINLVEVEVGEVLEVAEENFADVEKFPEINLPPIKIPETIQQKSQPKIAKTSTEKVAEESNNPKIISKVLPKDIFQTLITAGLIKERPTLAEGKVIVSITIDSKGKVSKVQIVSGHTGLIKIVSEAAASAWTFDTQKNPQELQTQIEFTPEDF